MKKVWFVFFASVLLFSTLSASGTENIKNVNSTITHVTVFSGGAQVTGISEVSREREICCSVGQS